MSEWNKTVLETLDAVVDFSTDKMVRPAHRAARMSVYGIVAATLVFLVPFFLFIAAFRATTIGVSVYGAYLIWGAIFLGVGALLWIKK